MKAMWAAFAAILVISVGAHFVLDSVAVSSAEKFSSSNARPPLPERTQH